MALLDFAFDYRVTTSFITDPAYGVGALNSTYPVTYTNGNGVSLTAGWSAIPDQTRNRSTGVDARLAGVTIWNSPSTNYFQVDLKNSGKYQFALALGDAGTAKSAFITMFDSASQLFSYSTDGAIGLDQFIDGNNVLRTSDTNWVNNNQNSPTQTFASTILRAQLVTTSDSAVLYAVAHLRILEQASPVVSPRSLMLLGVGA